jgi:hypothetical protein
MACIGRRKKRSFMEWITRKPVVIEPLEGMTLLELSRRLSGHGVDNAIAECLSELFKPLKDIR